MQEVPIHQNLLKKTYLASTKSEFDKLDSDEWEKVAGGLNSLKSKVGKLDVDNLKSVPADLNKAKWYSKKWNCLKDCIRWIG